MAGYGHDGEIKSARVLERSGLTGADQVIIRSVSSWPYQRLGMSSNRTLQCVDEAACKAVKSF